MLALRIINRSPRAQRFSTPWAVPSLASLSTYSKSVDEILHQVAHGNICVKTAATLLKQEHEQSQQTEHVEVCATLDVMPKKSVTTTTTTTTVTTVSTRVKPQWTHHSLRLGHGDLACTTDLKILQMGHNNTTKTTTKKTTTTTVKKLTPKPHRVVVLTTGAADMSIAGTATSVLETSNCGGSIVVERVKPIRNVIISSGLSGISTNVVGDWCSTPVITVPTTFGTHIQTISPLLTMLNCSNPPLGVVKIDDGCDANGWTYKITKTKKTTAVVPPPATSTTITTTTTTTSEDDNDCEKKETTMTTTEGDCEETSTTTTTTTMDKGECEETTTTTTTETKEEDEDDDDDDDDKKCEKLQG